MHVVGAGLHPAAWGALMGANAEGWANRAIDATAILGDTALDLHKAICAATQTSQRFDILCTFLAAATDEAMKTIATEFIHMMDAWLSERIDPEIDVLVQRTGLGMRQIERLAKRYYGLPPKTLARKYRALRVAAAMARGANLDELGLGDTFYDQSHLIRELKRFAGLTPQQIARHQSSMLLETSKGRKSLEGQVSSLVSDA